MFLKVFINNLNDPNGVNPPVQLPAEMSSGMWGRSKLVNSKHVTERLSIDDSLISLLGRKVTH